MNGQASFPGNDRENAPANDPGERPGQLPENRPGQRPTERPGTLPGFSPNDRVSDRIDQRGERLSNRQENVLDRRDNRTTNREDRRDGLQDRLDSRQDGRTDRQENRQEGRTDRVEARQDGRSDRLDSRQDFRSDARQDWQNYHDRHSWQHYGWHHGHHWYPGVRGDYWKHMFNNYPVASAFHWTRRIVNRTAWRIGYWGYTNPYYVSGTTYATSGGEAYSYAEPLIVDETAEVASPTEDPAPAAESATVEYPPGVTTEGMNAFDAARDAFYKGDSETALKKVEECLQEMPNDAVVHEFRSLVLFSLGKFDEAAATTYAVLAVGPGWDWTTLSSLYSNVDDYTTQFRALEKHAHNDPRDSAAQFLLAYHYASAGYDDAAADQYRRVLKLTPNNEVALDQLSQIEGPEAIAEYTKLPDNSDAESQAQSPAVDAKVLVGDWKAATGGSAFNMSLTDDGGFVWGFTSDGKTEKVAGVYALDGNVLAVELDSGDTLAAEITVNDSKSIDFKLITYRADEQPLKFIRN